MFGWLTNRAREKELSDALNAANAELASIKAASVGDILATTGTGNSFGYGPQFSYGREQLQVANRGWVFACVQAISSRIAGQEIKVGTKGKVSPRSARAFTPAGFRQLETHPLLDLLADPNDLQIGWSLMYFTAASLELTGRCLWYVPEGDEPTILPIPTAWISGFVGTTSFEAFKIRPAGKTEEIIIPADEACYFYYPSPSDPRESMSPLQAAASAVNADENIQTAQAAAFANGIFPRHALVMAKMRGPNGEQFAPALSDAQRRQILESVNKLYRGAARNGEALIIGDGLLENVLKLTATPTEMDFVDSGKATKSRICQIFGVNPIILGEIESANRASSLAAEEHLAATINPKLRLIGDTITEWLGPRFGNIKVWLDPYQPHDAEMELRKFTLLAQNGACSYNELRAFAGLPPTEMGDVPVEAGGGLDQGIGKLIDSRLASMKATRRLGKLLAAPRPMNGHKHSLTG